MLGRDGNIMDGEYSPSMRCSRRLKYNGWGAFPITPAISVPKVALQPNKLLYRWGALAMWHVL
jgi:hypothetical protein